ncbi:hypothetical protein [Enterobacter roggenkampii]|uniref:hypothetical protein n=1 Tax=Enterobacter roggenkampii TaxID=1812935 RepID=UPI00292BE3F7|nr:hypothetical protein [Enterobacter roggenkampii]MDV0481204.1 hypothetical protein [Enterobacter roggenkampii]
MGGLWCWQVAELYARPPQHALHVLDLLSEATFGHFLEVGKQGVTALPGLFHFGGKVSLFLHEQVHLLDEALQVVLALEVDGFPLLLVGVTYLAGQNADLVIDHFDLLLEVGSVELRRDRNFDSHSYLSLL